MAMTINKQLISMFDTILKRIDDIESKLEVVLNNSQINNKKAENDRRELLNQSLIRDLLDTQNLASSETLNYEDVQSQSKSNKINSLFNQLLIKDLLVAHNLTVSESLNNEQLSSCKESSESTSQDSLGSDTKLNLMSDGSAVNLQDVLSALSKSQDLDLFIKANDLAIDSILKSQGI